jgi:hypothetical protein
MRSRRSGFMGIGFIIMLVISLTIAWVGYEPMVVQRMGEDRAADQICLDGVKASSGIIRQIPVIGAVDAADIDYAFNVQNTAGSTCLARFEVIFLREGQTHFQKGDRVVLSGVTTEVKVPLGRYTRADAAAGRLPQGRELKVWGAMAPRK